jgi:segregation and condensation protein B
MKVAALEGLLFIVGEDGLDINKIEEILEVTYEELKELIKELCDMYSEANRGLQLLVLGNKLKLTTKKEHKEYYEKLVEEDDNILSQAALETLAIIAYNEPITRMKVDEVRGISSSHMIRKLLSKNLVKEVGRSDLPGRPILYGVTDEFLDYFGLSSTEELPKLEEVSISDEEKDLYTTRYNDSEN